MTLSATPLEKILQAVNEKYGTSFESWSQLPSAYEVGDTIPNWSTYEKLSDIRWVVNAFGAEGPFGIIENDTYSMYSNEENEVLITNNEGVIIHTQVYSSNFAYAIKQKLVNEGKSVENIRIITSALKVSENVPNWSLYKIIR